MSSVETGANSPTDGSEVEIDETTDMTRRGAMKTGAAVTMTMVGIGAATAPAAAFSDVFVDFSHERAPDPWSPGTVVVDTHESDMAELEYIPDDYEDGDSYASLTRDYGLVLGREPDEDDIPHNPVTIEAGNFSTDEYSLTPRDAVYDKDGDGNAETDVSILDATHWTVDESGSTGTLTVADEGDGIRFTADAQADTDTVTATFDLSTVADTDQTYTDGISRRFLAQVFDVDLLQTAATVEFAAVASDGTEIAATTATGQDMALESAIADSTGPSQVAQPRVGDIESEAGVELSDIQTVEVRVHDADADILYHGVNLERTSAWEFGSNEFYDSNDEVLDTEQVVEPTGTFSITSIGSIPAPLDSAVVDSVEYDVEMLASKLPDEYVNARTQDLGDGYDKPQEFEIAVEFPWHEVDAYELESVSADNLMDESIYPGRRYIQSRVASDVAEFEAWSDLDDATWSSVDYPSSSDTKVELLTSASAADRPAVHLRIEVSDEVADGLTAGGGAPVAADGEGGSFDSLKTILMGLFMGAVVWKRKAIKAVVGS